MNTYNGTKPSNLTSEQIRSRRNFLKLAVVCGLPIRIDFCRYSDVPYAENFHLSGSFNINGSFLPSDFGCQAGKNTRCNLLFERIVIESKDGVVPEKRNRGNRIILYNRICLEFSLVNPDKNMCVLIEMRAFDKNGKVLFEKSAVHKSNKETYSPRLIGSLLRKPEPLVRLDILIPDGISLNECKTLNIKVQECNFP